MGYSRAELLHLSWRDLLPAEDSGAGLLGLAERSNSHTACTQSQLSGKNGYFFKAEIRLCGLADGRHVAFVRNLGQVLNIAFVERVNLTPRQGVPALIRRTWPMPALIH